ncbi:glycoside hydrolase domain-containing protein [Streptomyces sp. NPDC053048]|uniref:glycoside hydrolase domain-containing protein n=1 Tax=Streptomyces sp. NPDC053048 TaxID=3365694 RepID=UPI0037D1A020
MADEMVRKAQQLYNATYRGVAGLPVLEENGRTSWDVMYALTRALQYELGIAPLSNNFGPATLAALQAKYPVVDRNNGTVNINRLVQTALYCKGYDGGDLGGVYDDRVAAAVGSLKQNMGVAGAFPGDGVTPKVFKALLTMDAYVTANGGSDTVRSIQQWLNGRYVDRRNFFVVPCDGHYSRDVQKALLFAIQYQLGMSDDVATGNFGPATKEGLKKNTVFVGSSGTFVLLFSAAMIFNKRTGVSFRDTFTYELSQAVRGFQDFVKLPVTGTGDFPTWASLLVSSGDTTRRGAAFDCVTEITPARADALREAGYVVAGRYLTNAPGSSWDKKIQPGELEVIRSKGLRVFPIYQTYGGSVSYFNENQGLADAQAAFDAARGYGFKRDTWIYFAVDFDVLDHQVTDAILPHFRGVKRRMDELGGGADGTDGTDGAYYRIGVYGPRNACSRVSAAGLATSAFVADMSTGFSGNLGYPLPENWAFDQIATVTVGSGDGKIEIDNNILSGLDMGQNEFDEIEGGR